MLLAIVAGIDEAGYGPVLGPLVVSGVAWRVPDPQIDQCLWKILRATCSPEPERLARRLTIADSKKLYRSRGSMAPLERAALVMLAVMGQRPTTWRSLLEEVAPGSRDQLQEYPWYANTDFPLPTSTGVGDVATRANAVHRDCTVHHIEPLGVFCEPLLEGHFNALVAKTRNKASVLMSLALRVADRMLRCSAEKRVRLYVDRLGGRQHYREAIATSWPDGEIHIVEESPVRSAYRLLLASRCFEIEFHTGGEQRHLPVALASIYSKYLRELFMHSFNDHWSKQITGLRPTAGYYTDAHRWLKEASPAIGRLGVNRRMLVRTR